ncbi:Mannose-6-phosphate isomerase 1 [Linum grandiflorum]
MDSSKNRRLRRLRCSVQHYDWGKMGKDSLVGRVCAFNSGTQIQINRPYAEFWMGIHDSGPSFVLDAGVIGNNSLKDWIARNPSVLGDKILSVGKALSIQAHPDKELAKKLHKLHPSIYKDGSDKPEMALAITEFEALCSFVSFQVSPSSSSGRSMEFLQLACAPVLSVAWHVMGGMSQARVVFICIKNGICIKVF